MICTENMELYYITVEKQTLLSQEACLVYIPRIGPVVYTVYNDTQKELHRLSDIQESEVIYSY